MTGKPIYEDLERKIKQLELEFFSAEKEEKKRRQKEYMTIFVQGKLLQSVKDQSIVDDAFCDCSSSVGSFVSLLWLAPDHVHVYHESDGEKSLETIAQEIKILSESSIIARASSMVLNAVAGNDLWDKAYFAETIG